MSTRERVARLEAALLPSREPVVLKAYIGIGPGVWDDAPARSDTRNGYVTLESEAEIERVASARSNRAER